MCEPVRPALHFIGFRESNQYRRAIELFGKPDFIHRHWDARAKYGGDTHPSDTFVFAKWDENAPIVDFVFDDSNVAPQDFEKSAKTYLGNAP